MSAVSQVLICVITRLLRCFEGMKTYVKEGQRNKEAVGLAQRNLNFKARRWYQLAELDEAGDEVVRENDWLR